MDGDEENRGPSPCIPVQLLARDMQCSAGTFPMEESWLEP